MTARRATGPSQGRGQLVRRHHRASADAFGVCPGGKGGELGAVADVAVRLRSPVASSVAARLAQANNSTMVSPACLAAAVPCSSRRAAEAPDALPEHQPAVAADASDFLRTHLAT